MKTSESSDLSAHSTRFSLRSLPLNKFGWTALNAACYFGQFEIIKYLCEDQNLDPNATNQNGWHSLIFTIMGSAIYSHFNYSAAENIINYLLTLPNIKVD
jgi:ankyrin repeat protein